MFLTFLLRPFRHLRERGRIILVALRSGVPSDVERAAARLLREEINALAPLALGATESEREWQANRAQVREDIRRRDPRFFLHWPVLRHTMVVDSRAAFIAGVELPAVRAAGWLDRLHEDSAGSPMVIPGTSTSGNLIHHAYHLVRFEQATDVPVSEFTNVVEVGAGYGSMARLLARLSRPNLTLLDLPEFSALQRYYLSLVGVQADLGSPDDVEPRPPNTRLLIATWSLSEMPELHAERLWHRLGVFDAYLIAYQVKFGELDNRTFFKRLCETRSEVRWIDEPIPHLPISRYLFGLRRSS